MVDNQELIFRLVKLIKGKSAIIDYKNDKLIINSKEYKIPKTSGVKKKDTHTFR